MNSLMNSKINSKLLRELQNQFTEEEQVVFVNSFYMYLNYHQTEDFVIDLGDVYEMIGFSRIDKAKRLLENNFTENEDYKIFLEQYKNPSLPRKGEQDSSGKWGGANKQKVMLNVDTFKNLCMIARTEKAKKIRMYYVKMESINMGIIKHTIQNTEEKTKQEQQRTRQLEIQLEIKKMDLEISKMKIIVQKKKSHEEKLLKKELMEEERRIQKIIEKEEIEESKKLQLKSIDEFVYHYARETRDMDDLIEIKYLFEKFKDWVYAKHSRHNLLKYSKFLHYMSGNFPVKFSKKNKGTVWLREFVLK